MIEAIQKGYYLRAMNPSEPDTLADLAVELGLKRPRFLGDLGSSQTETEFQRQLLLRAKLKVRSLPTLVLEHDTQYTTISHDYHDCFITLDTIHQIIKPSYQ
jgi:putative protein-disulfide isomerase